MTARDEARRNLDRTVHATSPDRTIEVARYDKAGHYRIETWDADGERVSSGPLTLTRAVDTAVEWQRTGGQVHLNRPSGMRFDAEIRRANNQTPATGDSVR